MKLSVDNPKQIKILFIYPSMGEKENYRSKIKNGKIKTTCLEPLTIATLSGLTPKKWEKEFFDDRIEDIDYNTDCDLVAITVESYTAKRAYEISKHFRDKGRKVIMGGFHPSILPEESLEYADSVVIGEAEEMWHKILADFENGTFKKIYDAESRADLSKVKVDRSIYGNKKYFPFMLIESGRGCPYNCEFCSVSVFFKRRFIRRPVEDIVEEIRLSKRKKFMFVDDNICGDIDSAKELFRALIPLKIQWASQAGIDITEDDELLGLLKKSGCIGLLIGFESHNPENLKQMNKTQNYNINIDDSIKKLYAKGIKIYGSFIIGYDYDDENSVKETVKYAIDKKLFIANFYQLTAMPGTALYKRLEKEKRLVFDKWWLNLDYSYGDLVFKPAKISAENLSNLCYKARTKFYSYSSIFLRGLNLKANSKNFRSFLFYILINLLTRKEAHKRQKRKLGREMV